jgi:hypothetical protein
MTAAEMFTFPAWELIRRFDRNEPRDWIERWQSVGGEIREDGRMIALKVDLIWDELGSSGNFDDALDVNHAPFAFNSGMRQRAVPREECLRLGMELPETRSPNPETRISDPQELPPAVLSVKKMDDAVRKKLATLTELKDGRAVYKSKLQQRLADLRARKVEREVAAAS